MDPEVMKKFEEEFKASFQKHKLVHTLKPEIQKIYDFVDNIDDSKYSSVEILAEILEFIAVSPENYNSHLELIKE